MAVSKQFKRDYPSTHTSTTEWFTDCTRGPVVNVTEQTGEYVEHFGEFFSFRLENWTAQVTREQLRELRAEIDTRIRAALGEEK